MLYLTCVGEGGVEAFCFRWAEVNKCLSRVHPAIFAGGLRGAAAACDIRAGDVVLSVPRKLLISGAAAEQSDLVCCSAA